MRKKQNGGWKLSDTDWFYFSFYNPSCLFFMIRVDPSPILFYFYFFIRSELVRVDPSWSDPNWRSELIRSDFCTCLILTTPGSDVHERLKTNGTAIKIAKRLLTINNKRKIIRWKIYRDNNFHSQRQVFNKVSLKILVYVLSRVPGVCFFQRWTRGKKTAQSFLLQPES